MPEYLYIKWPYNNYEVKGSIAYPSWSKPGSGCPRDPAPAFGAIAGTYSGMLDGLVNFMRSHFAARYTDISNYGNNGVSKAATVADVYVVLDFLAPYFSVDLGWSVSMYNDAAADIYAWSNRYFLWMFGDSNVNGSDGYCYGIHANFRTAYDRYVSDMGSHSNRHIDMFVGDLNSADTKYKSYFSDLSSVALNKSLDIARTHFNVLASVTNDIQACVSVLSSFTVDQSMEAKLSAAVTKFNSAIALIAPAVAIVNNDLSQIKGYPVPDFDARVKTFTDWMASNLATQAAIATRFTDGIVSFGKKVSDLRISNMRRQLAASNSVVSNRLASVVSSSNTELLALSVDDNDFLDKLDGIISRFSDSVTSILKTYNDDVNEWYADCWGTAFVQQNAKVNDIDDIVKEYTSVITPVIDAASDAYLAKEFPIRKQHFNNRLASIYSSGRLNIDVVLASLAAYVKTAPKYTITGSDVVDNVISKYTTDVTSSMQVVYDDVNSLYASYASAGSTQKNETSASLDVIQAGIRDEMESLSEYANNKFTAIINSYSTDMLVHNLDVVKDTFSTGLISSKSVLHDEIDKVSMAASNRAQRDIRAAVDNYLKSHKIARSLDSTALRVELSTVKRDLRGIANEIINNVSDQFSEDVESCINTFYSNVAQHYSELSTGANAANVNVPDASDKYAMLDSAVETLAADINSGISSYLDGVNSSLSQDIYNTQQYLSTAQQQYASAVPIIRVVEIVSFPSSFTSDSYPVFSFKVENLGSTDWLGWFGVKIIDSNGKEYTYNHRPLGLTSIPGRATKQVDIKVPIKQLIGDDVLGGVISSTLIANTYRGVVPSLQR